MTREEAKQWIEDLISTMKEETSGLFPDVPYKDEVYEALDEAVKALEQEPIIDKIRAEIETEYGDYDICEWYEDYDYEENNISEFQRVGSVSDILDIIDKYKEESEV